MRGAASKCGGVEPIPHLGLTPYPGWEYCADAGNVTYSALCDILFNMYPRPWLPAWCGGGYDRLHGMSIVHRGDVVEAALAAADCALAAEQHVRDHTRHPDWARDYRDVVGGGRTEDDAVTEWIHNTIHEMFRGGAGMV